MNATQRLSRYRDRACDDRARVDALLDEVMVAMVSTVIDDEPQSIPTFFARDDDRVLIHGSTGAGLLSHLASGAPATLTVHSLDAVVVAETAFESSANYRSAVLRGRFAAVPDAANETSLRLLTDRLIPGRTREVPPSTRKDLTATTVLSMPITPGGWIYKARTGPSGRPDPVVPDVWVGIVPMRIEADAPVADSWVASDVPVPTSVLTLVDRHRRA